MRLELPTTPDHPTSSHIRPQAYIIYVANIGYLYVVNIGYMWFTLVICGSYWFLVKVENFFKTFQPQAPI